MHQRTCVLLALLAGLWLMGPASEHAAAQLPKEGAFMLFVGDTRELTMSQLQLISAARSVNPKIAAVSLRKDDPRVALVTGITEGQTDIFLTDTKGKEEKHTVTVSTSGSVLQMAVLQRMAEQRRLALEEMIRRTVPTANVQVMVFGYTVVLKGTVQKSEDVQIVMELARSVYPEFQVPGAQQTPGAQPPAPPPGGQPLPQGQGQGPLLINALRIGGVQQVAVEVIVVRVARSELRNMTFNFLLSERSGDYLFGNILRPSTLANGSTLASETAAAALQFAATGANIPISVVTNKHTLVSFLEALRTEGLAKFNAHSTVTTLSGRPGNVASGGEVPVLTSSGQGAPSISYKQFGTIVDFLPIVLGDGKIYMEIRPSVSARNGANDLFIAGVTPTAVPGFDNRSAQVTVMMEDGETLAIGGLIQHTVDGTTAKVPILGDLPFIGAAFRSVSYQEREEELLILVTPRLVHPMACCQLPKYLPGEETRRPDDFELFLEGILEAPRGPRTVLCGVHYIASHHLGPTAGAYPCGGDNGPHCGLFGKCEAGEKDMGCGWYRNGCGNSGHGGHGVVGHGHNGHHGHLGTTPTPSFSVHPMPRTVPAGNRELPLSPVPTQSGNGGELSPFPRAPHGAMRDVPPPRAALGPVIEDE